MALGTGFRWGTREIAPHEYEDKRQHGRSPQTAEDMRRLVSEKASERDDNRKAVGDDLSVNAVQQSIMCVGIHGLEWIAHRKVNGGKPRGNKKRRGAEAP